MTLFFDTSALLKRYLDETGSDRIKDLFDQATSVFVSAISPVECASAFQRLFYTHDIDKRLFQKLTLEVSLDFAFFQTVDFDTHVKDICLKLLTKYPLKSLDTIQLASLLSVAQDVEYFIVCDQQLKRYAIKEGIHVIDPTQ
jgi:predicted nucleic acid-binding protein